MMDGRANVSLLLLVVTGLICLVGCSATSNTPAMGFGKFDIKTDFTRNDLVIMNKVEGSSSEINILLGLVSIVDETNVKLLGIPLGWTEKYTESGMAMAPRSGDLILDFIQGFGRLFNLSSIKPCQRAYYKALKESPDADTVFHKTIDSEWKGIPWIFEHTTVTYSGKAMKIKQDEK